MRALTATTRFFFIGYSLSDSYFNELRSEVLAMRGGGDEPFDCLGYHVTYWKDEETPVDAVRLDVDYKRNHEGLLSLPIGPAACLREVPQAATSTLDLLRLLVREASPQYAFAKSFNSRRVLVLASAEDFGGANGIEETLLALFSLAWAVRETETGGIDGTIADGGTSSGSGGAGAPQHSAEEIFRDARNEAGALADALAAAAGASATRFTRPSQCLPLPRARADAREGMFFVAFSAADFSSAAARCSWDAFLLAADASDELPALRSRSAATAAVPALAYWPRKAAPAPASLRAAKRASLRGCGFVDCVEDGEALNSALRNLLADAPPV
jgi:hypothetical protein